MKTAMNLARGLAYSSLAYLLYNKSILILGSDLVANWLGLHQGPLATCVWMLALLGYCCLLSGCVVLAWWNFRRALVKQDTKRLSLEELRRVNNVPTTLSLW